MPILHNSNSYDGTESTGQYMKYGTTRMNTQDAIISVLNEHKKLRFGELSKIIVEKKKICSERIFRETLAYLVNKKIIKKIEIARNNTLYTIDSEITPLSDEEINEMIETLDDLKDETKKILQVISSDANDSAKANEIIKYLQLLSLYEMQTMILSHVSGKPKLKKYSTDVMKYKKTVLESLNKKSSSAFTPLGALVYWKLFMEALKHFPEEAEDFVTSFNDMLKEKRQETKK
jgi:hypothetical protein